MEMTDTKYLNRPAKEKKVFKVEGTFQGMYAAISWSKEQGYSYGSTSGRGSVVALRKGEYDLPQKWHNFSKQEKRSIDGYILSYDYREGEVTVVIFT